MPLLALNTVLPQTMRVKYQLAVGALPVGLMFASFLPLLVFGSWLEAALGIPANSPIRNHPHGALWTAVFLGCLVLFMTLGYAAGWLANAAIASLLFGWPLEKVRAVYLRSEVPAHWLRGGAATSLDVRTQALAKWEEQRKAGVVRFILNRGVLAWGAPMLLAMYVLPTIARGRPFTVGAMLFNLALWVAAGAAFGAVIWFTSEANYRKLRERK